MAALQGLLLASSSFFSLCSSRECVSSASLPEFVIHVLYVIVLSFTREDVPTYAPVYTTGPFAPRGCILAYENARECIASDFSSTSTCFSFYFSDPIPVELGSTPMDERGFYSGKGSALTPAMCPTFRFSTAIDTTPFVLTVIAPTYKVASA